MSGSSAAGQSDSQQEEEEDADYDPDAPDDIEEKQTGEVVEESDAEQGEEEINIISHRYHVSVYENVLSMAYLRQNTVCPTAQTIKNYR